MPLIQLPMINLNEEIPCSYHWNTFSSNMRIYAIGSKLTYLRHEKPRLKRNEMKGLEQLSMPNSPTLRNFHLGSPS